MMIDMTNSPRTIPAKCLGFYLLGREDSLRIKAKDVAQRVLADYFGARYPGPDAIAADLETKPCLRERVHRECLEEASAIGGSAKKRRRWAEDHASEIKTAGVSDTVAFDTYLMGCADEAALAIEGTVLDQVFKAYDDSDDGDSDDDDPEDESDDDEEDDDDED